jgi:hypothetical protein
MRKEQHAWFYVNATRERNNTLVFMQTPHAKGTTRLILCKRHTRKEQHAWFYANYPCEWNNTLSLMQTTHAKGTKRLFLCIIYLEMCIIHFSSHEK